MVMTGAQPAGWLPDPNGRHELRYWDGAQWTDNVSDSGVVSQHAYDPAATAPPPPPEGGIVPAPASPTPPDQPTEATVGAMGPVMPTAPAGGVGYA